MLGAQLLEGGAPRALLQGPAALIVFGGTLAAVLDQLLAAGGVARFARVAEYLRRMDGRHRQRSLSELVAIAGQRASQGSDVARDRARATSTIALPARTAWRWSSTARPSRRCATWWRPSAARARPTRKRPARVFEAAAGYAPTLGILGAVLGLIQVMQHLSEPGALGSGIAVAFVATVYGVGVANLVLLPLAGRLRERAARRQPPARSDG